MGRKKIKIEKIECATKRHMTFHNRSRGILKKAKELSVLCEADVALIIIPPAGKAQLFSTQPRIGQVIKQFYANTKEGNDAGMCSNDKDQRKGGCCGTNPSSGVPSAHGLKQMQQTLVFEPTKGREQVPIQRVPFVEMEDPCPTHVYVPQQVTSSEVSLPYGASGYTQGPLVGSREMPFSSGVHVHQPSSLWCLPGGEARQLGHFSSQPSLQVLEAFGEPQQREQVQVHGVQGVPFVEMGDVKYVPEQFIISEIRGQDGVSNYMQGPPVYKQQIENGPPGANPSSGVQSAHGHIQMQQLQLLETGVQQDIEQAQMPGIPFVEMRDSSSIQKHMPGQCTPLEVSGPYVVPDHMRDPLGGGCEMHFSSGVELSLSPWMQEAAGEIGVSADQVVGTVHGSWSVNELREMSHILDYDM